MTIPILALSLLASAQQVDSLFQLPAVETASAPTIDGVVGAEEWRAAALATDFIQYEPRRGSPSEVRTEALVMYDSASLYVAFRVFDPEPVAAQLTRRDADLNSDDAVALLLDSFGDRQSASLAHVEID